MASPRTGTIRFGSITRKSDNYTSREKRGNIANMQYRAKRKNVPMTLAKTTIEKDKK